MTDPTTKRIAEIKERCENATDGHWSYQSGIAGEIDLFEIFTEPSTYKMLGKSEIFQEDAEFIVNSRADIPWLISELERTREALGVAREIFKGECCCEDLNIHNEWNDLPNSICRQCESLTQIDNILAGK